ncbi:MAG: zf-HC2 domain-containing protein, partial [Armatimonadota bacterium]|nr:zf-HC2 domain-containing protein [Armatimonadota bacterium]
MSTHLANTHPSADDLSAYLDHEVDAQTRAVLEGHLEACPSCRARLDALEQTVGAVRALGPVSAPPAVRAAVYDRLRRERRWPGLWLSRLPPSLEGSAWRLAGAAVAILLVGLFAANLWQQAVPEDEGGTALPRLGPGAPSAPGRAPATPALQPAVQTVGSGAGTAPVIR